MNVFFEFLLRNPQILISAAAEIKTVSTRGPAARAAHVPGARRSWYVEFDFCEDTKFHKIYQIGRQILPNCTQILHKPYTNLTQNLQNRETVYFPS